MRDINNSMLAAEKIIKEYPKKDITIKEIDNIIKKSGYKQDKLYNGIVYGFKLGLYVGYNINR